ncbi:hypothetical protein AsAng_0027480 [Aureispira anguillae]|uniref:Uncharacterized protein n=1 Tax=Aureispira anguillae TaxID=2864201 RepID=A0A915YFH2_9BACT|nr:hypothetical protein AsAng_0027480 [Aureispira anguillae]
MVYQRGCLAAKLKVAESLPFVSACHTICQRTFIYNRLHCRVICLESVIQLKNT